VPGRAAEDGGHALRVHARATEQVFVQDAWPDGRLPSRQRQTFGDAYEQGNAMMGGLDGRDGCRRVPLPPVCVAYRYRRARTVAGRGMDRAAVLFPSLVTLAKGVAAMPTTTTGRAAGRGHGQTMQECYCQSRGRHAWRAAHHLPPIAAVKPSRQRQQRREEDRPLAPGWGHGACWLVRRRARREFKLKKLNLAGYHSNRPVTSQTGPVNRSANWWKPVELSVFI